MSPAATASLRGHLFDDVAARIADGVDGVAEADDDFVVGDAAADIGFGLVGRGVAALNLERDFVGAAVLGPLSAPMAPAMEE